ncbi:MAG: hypothetical protein RLZ12_860 [Bacillota bacterium]|jgi:metallophosphoesterase (TIGR00282 family)
MIGDIFGPLGVKLLSTYLPTLKKEFKPVFIVANAENAAKNGRGVTNNEVNAIFNAGVHCITLGNHTWAKSNIFNIIENERIVRPANFPASNPGKGVRIIQAGTTRLAVINLLGRCFMNGGAACPFLTADELINDLPASIPILVDIHTETTSEKLALAWYLDGKVSAVVGTHTHVQTADERILTKGTGYLTDVGMVGPYDGIIGLERQPIINKYTTGLPSKFTVATGRGQFNGVVLTIDQKTCQTKNIQRIRIDDDSPFLG